jgi:hypothetical protein
MITQILYEEYCFLECDAMLSGRSLSIFQRYLLPPSSGRKVSQATNNKHGESREGGAWKTVLTYTAWNRIWAIC